jgi:N-acetylglucosamine-6-phosphate deacetylase
VLFNDDPTPRGIAAIAEAHRRFGTTALLPTLLSDTPATMRAARDAVEAIAVVDPSVIGLHFEGPFLSPDKAGAHDPEMLRRPGPGDAELLTPLRNGATLVTLAPEQVPADFLLRSWRVRGCGFRPAIPWRLMRKPARGSQQG